MDNLIQIGQALAEKSIAVSITIIVAAMYGFIKTGVNIIMLTNSRFDQLRDMMEDRATKTNNTMANEVARLHTHVGASEQLLLSLTLALMKVVPDANFQDKATTAIEKMQTRKEEQYVNVDPTKPK